MLPRLRLYTQSCWGYKTKSVVREYLNLSLEDKQGGKQPRLAG